MFDSVDTRRSIKILLGALVFTLGAQSIRFLFGSMAWYLRDTVGIGVLDLIPIALAPFLLSVIFPMLSRWLTVRGATWLAVILLATGRVVNQVSGSPLIDFWSAAVATMAFVGVLPLLLSMGRTTLVGGVLLGLAVDTALRGAFLGLDLAYQQGPAAAAVVVGLAVATLYVLWACPVAERMGVPWGPGWRLIGMGPFLFFQFLILQSQGWTAEVIGGQGSETQLRIALLNVVALILVSRFEGSRPVGLLAAAVLVAALVMGETPGMAFNVLSLLAIPAAGIVWANLVPDLYEGGVGSSATHLTIGAVLLVIIGLAYYVPLDMNLGFTQSQVRVAVAVILGLIGLAGALSQPAVRPGVAGQTWAFAALAAVLPLLGLVGNSGGTEGVAAQYPVRIMSYNIHSGFGADGTMDLEAIARVIEDSRATLVGLQEVSRGQLISGVADQLSWLAKRLGFEHVEYFGTTDPTFGNAVLSRYPILEVTEVHLPKVGTPLRRGYLGATIQFGDDEILFISTHLQHVNDPDVHDQDPEGDLYPVHHEQIETILTEWGGVTPAILVGDFNSRPGWRQLDELMAAGWVDSWAEAGMGEGFTSNSANPEHRIDYVFHTDDLVAVDVGVIQSRASDHFAVVADIQPSE
ncbi:MAG TPA: endonuclease/exonuclease/phosphatase family protein [Acidimicrobiia bacterium]